MKSCVIVAEYNPFHHGHAYHVAQAKKHSGADVMIALMSGNMVQRGEFASVDKWKRTAVALANGIDVVIELPTVAVVQSADYFGHEAMRIVKVLQAQALSFGMETPHLPLALSVAKLIELVEQRKAEAQTTKKSFATSFHQNIIENIRASANKEQLAFLERPNNQLALSYILGCQKENFSLEFVPIARRGAEHGDVQVGEKIEQVSFASGSAIRRLVSLNRPVSEFVPRDMAVYLEESMADSAAFWTVLKWAIISHAPEELALIHGVTEGIEFRLKAHIFTASDYDTFVQKISHKRWSTRRVQRMCLAIVLHMTKETVREFRTNPVTSLRVLGMSDCGTAYMRQLKDVDVVTQFKKEHQHTYWKNQMMYDAVYREITQNYAEQNFRRIIRV